MIILCVSIFFLEFSNPGIKGFLYGVALTYCFIGSFIHWGYIYHKNFNRKLPYQTVIWSRKFNIASSTSNIPHRDGHSIKSIGILLKSNSETSELIKKIQNEETQIKVQLNREEKGDYQKMVLDFSFFIPIAITKDNECIPLIDWSHFSSYQQIPSVQKFMREREINQFNREVTKFNPLPMEYVRGSLFPVIHFIDGLLDYYPNLRENTNFLIDDIYYVTKWTSGQKIVPDYGRRL